jgi:outer membrane lipoprotein carrier protein
LQSKPAKNQKFMKKNIFTTLLISIILTGQAQTGYLPATELQQKELTQKITDFSTQLKTLQCDFVQKKTISILSEEMISEGKMYFKQKDKLRWEYTKPYQYEFVMNGEKLMTNTGTAKNVMNANSSKMFRRISKIIISGIIGSGIFDDSTFTANFFEGAKDYMVALTPKQKELKQMFKEIRISFNKTDNTVNSVEIEELNGDKTLIEMKNKQINKELSDEMFIIKNETSK